MLIFDAFLLYKKISHSIRRTIVGKRKLHVQNYSFDVERLPKSLPRLIWMFWDKPVETAPPFVRYSIETWKTKNPTWEVRILDNNSLTDYLDTTFVDDKKKIQGRSDAIRLALLEKFGGVWIDASCSCVAPLDGWLPVMMQSGFFAFPDTYPGRVVQSWFLAATPGNYLVRKWSKLATRYYNGVGKPGHYFWVMYLFEYIVRTDRKAAKIWDRTPKVSAKGASILKRIITQKHLVELIPADIDLSAVPVLKISTSTKSEDPEFVEAISQHRDIDLHRMIDNVLVQRDRHGTL